MQGSRSQSSRSAAFVRCPVIGFGSDLQLAKQKFLILHPLLKDAGFAPLADEHTFAGVYIDYGVTVWNDGDIDIAPEYLYRHSKEAEGIA